MNGFAVVLILSIILIPNAIFAAFLMWSDVRLTRKGDRYLDVVFGGIILTLFLAVLGIVGYIETEGM